MPETMLKKMLFSLCSSGAEFCRPEKSPGGLERGPESDPAPLVRGSGGFSDYIPGGARFSPAPSGDHPYYPPERHPGHVEIILPVSGKVDFLFNGRWQLLPENRVHVLLRNTLHTERHFQDTPYTLLWLSCLPSTLTLFRTAYSPESGYGQSACRVAISPPMTRQLWQCGAAEQVDEIHYFSLLVQCLEYAVNQHLAVECPADYHDAVLSQLREYLAENFSRQITLEELAGMAHLSPIHLNRLFSRKYGVSLHRYLNLLRLEEAKTLLLAGRSAGEAARSAGFTDQRYFSRFFRQHTGLTPTAFQKVSPSPPSIR